MTSFFHSYDLRGKYPDEIGKKEAEKVGKAYGTFTDAQKVLVGRDGRKHGEDVTDAFIRGVLSTGTDIVYGAKAPSPVVYYGMVAHDIPASVVVTASHNPSEYTGFKFTKKGALAMSRKGGMAEIEQIYESGEFEEGKGEFKRIDLGNGYVEFVRNRINLEKTLEVAVNFGNGVTPIVGKEMLEGIGCNIESVNDRVDGSFPNHLPDPTNVEAQKALKPHMEEKDLGIIFDGDGDRAGFILPEYGYISEDEILALFSEETLRGKKGKVVHDLRASKLVPEIIENNGGEPQETRVGHTFISEEIHSDPEIVFAGELSGHFYFPEFDVPWDDGLFAAALMCQIVSERDVLEELENYPDYPVSPELRIDCPEKAKQKVTEAIKKEYSDYELSTMDGVKIQFDTGWALVRPSSTEEKMSVRCEADTEEDVERILGEIEGKVEEFIEDFS
jgi:phosphomannomutase/phosphoglucomutase